MNTPEKLVAEHRDDVALAINISGGKDSSRMLGYVRSRFPDVPTYCVMADTGFEHVRPVPAVDWSRQMAARFGLGLTVVRNPKKTYLEMVRRRGMFLSAQFRQCTSDLKRGPIQKFVRGLPHRVIAHRELHGHARGRVAPARQTTTVVARRSAQHIWTDGV